MQQTSSLAVLGCCLVLELILMLQLPLTERGVVGVHVLGCEELADERRLPRVVHPQHAHAVLHLGRSVVRLAFKLAAERVAGKKLN